MGWMRQRGDDARDEERPVGGATPSDTPASRSAAPSMNIGPSVTLKGELSGNEDLSIDGVVEGRIVLAEHQLTVGPNGRVTAEIRAKRVSVDGRVEGNITASDRVEIGATGVVHGDIRSPRVAIEDGAKFKGSIDMEREPTAGTVSSAAAPRAALPRSARSV